MAKDKRKILFVDDEEPLCQVVKMNLEATGQYEVRTVSKGAETLETAKEFKPDVILLDFIMPDMDGADVERQLEGDPDTQFIPIIFITAIATKQDTGNEDSVIGGRFVLAKPVTTEELVESIEKKIQSK